MKIKTYIYRFTILELLIVITVIAIMVALLFPALRMTKITANRIFCTNNQKQIGIVTANYLTDYDFFFPTACIDSGTGMPAIGKNWVGVLNEQVNKYSLFLCQEGMRQGRYWSNTYNGGEYKSNYGLNTRLGNYTSTGGNDYSRPSTIKKPTDTILLGETSSSSGFINSSYTIVPMHLCIAGTNCSGNVLFVDLHVETLNDFFLGIGNHWMAIKNTLRFDSYLFPKN